MVKDPCNLASGQAVQCNSFWSAPTFSIRSISGKDRPRQQNFLRDYTSRTKKLEGKSTRVEAVSRPVHRYWGPLLQSLVRYLETTVFWKTLILSSRLSISATYRYKIGRKYWQNIGKLGPLLPVSRHILAFRKLHLSDTGFKSLGLCMYVYKP